MVSQRSFHLAGAHLTCLHSNLGNGQNEMEPSSKWQPVSGATELTMKILIKIIKRKPKRQEHPSVTPAEVSDEFRRLHAWQGPVSGEATGRRGRAGCTKGPGRLGQQLFIKQERSILIW